ncbi:AcrB/AcrD/AcrF family protein [Nostoc sphaeroides CCNUC1]|uniref:AcrB/AcrD/AcrF family protein n=1 Tax=Nostoc sphaeroides CCNUC1 TaxID=2653204 RepID=A0A5P8VUX5_9NOSO|nr:AcrB/AcrD/AcrF family protein [Nostoc sphaeroides CCNUC1]
MGNGAWGIGHGAGGDEGEELIHHAQSPIPNPQSPIPNPQSPIPVDCRQLAQKPSILERSL